MRKFLCSICFCALFLLTGCESPISGVGLTANPNGTFGVNVQLKNGGSLAFDNVTPGQLASLQKKYRIPASMIQRSASRDLSPCAYGRGFEPIQAVQARELAKCDDGRAGQRYLVRSVAFEPPPVEVVELRGRSMVSRFRSAFTPNCNCGVQAVNVIPEPDVQLPPVFEPPPSLPPVVSDGLPPSGIMKGPTVSDSRITALEVAQKADHATLESIQNTLDKLVAKLDGKK